MRTVSPAEVERQIRCEGARFGLFPLMQGGKCFVAQKERVMVEGPIVSSFTEELVAICSVNMNAPLGNVWKSRKKRHEFNVAKFYTENRLRREAAAAKRVDEAYADRCRELRAVGRREGTQAMGTAFMAALRRLRPVGA